MLKIPAAEKARSASRLQMLTARLKVRVARRSACTCPARQCCMANNAISALIVFISCLASWELGLGVDVWELGVGQGTAGKLGWESVVYSDTLKNVEQVFLTVSVYNKAVIPGLPSLTAVNNYTANY
jgi:hypothetical protein